MTIETQADSSAASPSPASQSGRQPIARSAQTSSRWDNLLERFGTYILSLVLALVVWIVAVNENNPMIQNSYASIPIEVLGPDEGLSPRQDVEGWRVDLTIRAPSRSWESVDGQSDFLTASVDLTDLEAGSHVVPIEIEMADPRMDIVEQRPLDYAVELEEVLTKIVPVRIAVNGLPAEGYQTLEPITSAISATVTGRSSQLANITHVGATVDLDGDEKNQVEDELLLEARNGQDIVASGLSIDPAEVTVVVPIEQPPGRKEVAVRPDLEGEPAGGYRLSSLRVEPSSVTLVGDAAVLEQVPGSVETSVFSLNDATADFTRPVELLLPEGVTTLDGRNTVMVMASITPIEGGRTITLAPIIDGLAPEYEADVALDGVDVIISGPVSMLESLEADDMFVMLDLGGLVPGVHNLEPQVVLPDGVKREAVIPETVEVVIREKAAAEAEADDDAQAETQTELDANE